MLKQRNRCWREGIHVFLALQNTFLPSIRSGYYKNKSGRKQILCPSKNLLWYVWSLILLKQWDSPLSISRSPHTNLELVIYITVNYVCGLFGKLPKKEKKLLRANLKIIFILKIQEIIWHILNMYIPVFGIPFVVVNRIQHQNDLFVTASYCIQSYPLKGMKGI